MRFFKVFCKAAMTFPFVILFWQTPSMMRMPAPLGWDVIQRLSTLIFNFILFSHVDDIGWLQNKNLWPYIGLFLFFLFVITFKQTEKHMAQDEEYEARCAAEHLERQQNNPWGPYFGQPIDAVNVNIELKNGKILWRVPASKLEEMAEDVKLWMPKK